MEIKVVLIFILFVVIIGIVRYVTNPLRRRVWETRERLNHAIDCFDYEKQDELEHELKELESQLQKEKIFLFK